MTPTNQTKAMEATPRPWKVADDNANVIRNERNELILSVDGVGSLDCDDANAALIVQAVNQFEAHTKLATLVEELLVRMDYDDNHSESRLQFANKSDFVADVRNALIEVMRLAKENPKA